jgi:hypothetical protein
MPTLVTGAFYSLVAADGQSHGAEQKAYDRSIHEKTSGIEGPEKVVRGEVNLHASLSATKR